MANKLWLTINTIAYLFLPERNDDEVSSSVIGLKSRASEILSRKRPMSINIIRKLSTALSIPADILIQPYETVQ